MQLFETVIGLFYGANSIDITFIHREAPERFSAQKLARLCRDFRATTYSANGVTLRLEFETTTVEGKPEEYKIYFYINEQMVHIEDLSMFALVRDFTCHIETRLAGKKR